MAPQVPAVPEPGVQRATLLTGRPPAVVNPPPTTRSLPNECSVKTPPSVPLPSAAHVWVDALYWAMLLAGTPGVAPAVENAPPAYNTPLLWTRNAKTLSLTVPT